MKFVQIHTIMRLVWVWGYVLVILVTGILLISIIPVEANEPCSLLDARYTWNSYDNIYTGKVVSISNQTEYVKNDFELNEWQKSADVRINFELEHLLKGNPQTNWHRNVPLEGYCPGDFCVSGADHYTIGSEIFYIESYNGNGYRFDGACGIGSIKVGGSDLGGTVKDFFDYFEEIYGIPVEKSTHTHGEKTKCKNSEHLLVLRDNNKRVCVSEKTSQKMNWQVIETMGIQFQNTTNTEIKYDYPLSSKTTQVKNNRSSPHYQFDSETILSNLPKIGEIATLTMTYTNLEENSLPRKDEMIQFTMSDNFRFVGIDEKEIQDYDYRIKEAGYYYNNPRNIEGHGSYSYIEEFQSIKQHHENTFSITIEAISEGFGTITTVGRGHQYQLTVFVDKDQTLLVEDYYKIHYPIPETQISKQLTSKQPEYTIIPPTSDHSEYGYKVLYKNDIVETNYDHQTSGKIPLDSFYKDRQGNENANIIDDYEISLKLPTMIEPGEISTSLTIIDDYPLEMMMAYPEIHFVISQNLDFVGIPSDEIKISHPSKKHFTYPVDASDLQSRYTETLFATIKALRTGTADISIYLGEHHKTHYSNIDYYSDQNTFAKNYRMVIGEDETLLMNDYFKKYLSGSQ